jgi:hypothetical protein
VVEGKYVGFTNNQRMTRALPANATYTFGFHVQPQGGGSASCDVLLIQEGATVHGILNINFSTGAVTISRNGSIPASATVAPFRQDVWRWVEVRYKVDNSAGEWEVRVDGTTVIGPTSSLDTNNAGAVGTISAYRLGAGLSQEAFYADNFYAASGSAGFQGEGRCVTDMPTADGGLVAWAASAGNDFACVDEIPQNGDTDYISSATSTDRDCFTFATFGLTGTIKALVISAVARKDDAAARVLNPFQRRSSTNQDHADTWTLSTSYAKYEAISVLDPHTGSAYLDSNIDSTELGVEVV